MRIESTQNERVKSVRRLYLRRFRRLLRQTVVEGERLIREALQREVAILEVFYAPELLHSREARQLVASLENRTSRPPVEVAPQILRLLCDTEHPQGIVAVIGWPEPNPSDWREALRCKQRMLLLDRIQDPGNLGTILRAAAAFGVDAVFCRGGTTDVMAPKVIRSSMGALFHLPVYPDLVYDELRVELQSHVPHRFAATVRGGRPPAGVRWRCPWILAFGNEASGLDPAILQDGFFPVTIPMAARVESINVAMAAAVLLYESAREAETEWADGK